MVALFVGLVSGPGVVAEGRSPSPLVKLAHLKLQFSSGLGPIEQKPISLQPRISPQISPLITRALNPRFLGNGNNYDPELRSVLELATDEELLELQDILFGPSVACSYFSPLLKSFAKHPDVDQTMEGNGVEGRDDFIDLLESRFLFLAADARSTLRGWRPSYRDVLLGVRRKLHVPCSSKLSTEDLEVEIFLHLLNEYASPESVRAAENQGKLEVGLSKWKIDFLGAVKVGAKEFQQVALKGGGIFTLGKLYQWLAGRLSGKMLAEAANYQIRNEVIKRGGQFAAVNMESRLGLLLARQGLSRAASRYIGLRSAMTLLGPLLWGTFLADVVIQMLGTDYARVLRAIYAFALIRLTKAPG
ncbi:uncharacterized protein LOC144713872 isoform X2 [Wolffia australiana]